MATQRFLSQRKTAGGLEKVLANLWSRQKITKKPTLVVDQKPNGKCQLKSLAFWNLHLLSQVQ
jgi:hypothetical protein